MLKHKSKLRNLGMGSKEGEIGSTEGEIDYISSLPDDILHQILLLLCAKVAVQSSILSKRWRHVWKYLPALKFKASKVADYSFISRSMDLYRGSKLTSLSVTAYTGISSVPPVYTWVEFAALKGVKELKLNIFTAGEGEYNTRFFLPEELFNSDSIEVLNLSHVMFYPPEEGFSGLRNLKNFELGYSDITGEAVSTLLSTCGLLESLEIHNCSGPYMISTSSIKLKNVGFHWKEDDENLSELVLDVPNLESFSYSGALIPTRLNGFKGCARVTSITRLNVSNAVRMLKELSHVTVLTVDDWFTWSLFVGYFKTGTRAMPFKNLEIFCWRWPLRSKTETKLLVAFLGDCPSLREIKLHFIGPPEEFWEEADNDQPEIHISNLSQLRVIEVIEVISARHKCDMKLLQILLRKAVNLERLCVAFGDPQSGCRPKEADIKILQEQFSLLHRAAVHSQLLFGTWQVSERMSKLLMCARRTKKEDILLSSLRRVVFEPKGLFYNTPA